MKPKFTTYRVSGQSQWRAVVMVGATQVASALPTSDRNATARNALSVCKLIQASS